MGVLGEWLVWLELAVLREVGWVAFSWLSIVGGSMELVGRMLPPLEREVAAR
jgi:hypothetical protein